MKRVTFSSDDPVVYILEEARGEWMEYRKPYWEHYALDRFRFKKRINDLEIILNPILTPEHRNYMRPEPSIDRRTNRPSLKYLK